MTPAARQRLQLEFDRADYRARVAKRIGLALAVLGILSLLMAAVTGCSVVASVVAGCNEAGDSTPAIDHTLQTEIPKLTDP